ncbi:hypothetical protein CPB85DRAFT_1333584 [Mucidula mucida]|nr:hypothetical protein CPB85DRAFT_1333584 [Mucidula mucida]
MDRPHNPYASESTNTSRVSSPLNPSAPPRSEAQRPRPQSTSTPLKASPAIAACPLVETESTFMQRTRSRSTVVFDESIWKKALGSPSTASEHWWGSESRMHPWRDTTKKHTTIPAEQREGWDNVKKRVAKAASSILGTTLEVGHEALLLSTDLLEYAPIPGLQNVARTLLQIWDALELVDMNRSACLRLTERCADILLAVRQEIKDAGDQVGEELKLPITTLGHAFESVRDFLIKEADRPFLKRYLRREENRREIAGCDHLLHEALGMFSISIQIRILKQVQQAEQRTRRDTQVLLDAIKRSSISTQLDHNALGLSGIREDDLPGSLTPRIQQGLPPSSSHASLQSPSPPEYSASLPPTTSKALHAPDFALSQSSSSSITIPGRPDDILPTLNDIRARQNEYDAVVDMADLRTVLRTALSAGSDVEMLETLGISRDDMPEAIKTLQRALERLVEKQGTAVTTAISVPEPVAQEEVVTRTRVENNGRNKFSKITRRLSVNSSARITRSKTISTASTLNNGDSDQMGLDLSPSEADTLDREFIETGIDALRRLSHGAELNLPSWTITRFEVDREAKIGIGFFSDVYRGTWRDRTVAIKVLAETTPRKLFIHEVEIWKTLSHPNVLKLYGASSTSGDPPWFFVSPYEQNGTLTEYLRQVEGGRIRTSSLPEFRYSMGNISALARTKEESLAVPLAQGRVRSGSGSVDVAEYDTKGLDLLKFVYEIAKGMQYLHSKGVLHGDLKASNVLVNDEFRCVITDFGQSEMKSEAFRLSGTPLPHGALRWQSPEIMMGLSGLTPAVDVYAFAMTCMEILSMGRVPWAYVGDDTVRHFVLKENSRPLIPITPYTKPGNPPVLQELLRNCWHRESKLRPDFVTIVKDVKMMRLNEGVPEDVISPKIPEWTLPSSEDFDDRVPSSPDLRPTSFLSGAQPHQFNLDTMSQSVSFHGGVVGSPPLSPSLTAGASALRMSMLEPYALPVTRAPSAAASEAPSTQSEEDSLLNMIEDDYESPPAINATIADTRDERRYRLLLSHKFHPSLTLPLWSPSLIHLGAVGYLHKPEGTFVTLFNAINPSKSPDNQHPHTLPSIHGYGSVSAQSSRYDQRNAAQRGFDAITGIFRRPDGPSTRYTHPLRAGHKAAFMYTESTSYKYLENLEAPKKWFKATIDEILAIYGTHHSIQREDVFLVIGTLSAADYALFVSHNHPDGHARFNVLPPKNNMPWGVIKTDTEIAGGPSYHEPIPGGSISNSKVSRNGSKDVTLLLARLRFKPDGAEPTSL